MHKRCLMHSRRCKMTTHCFSIRPKITQGLPMSTRVLVRPIGLNMVAVGGSNPPGPTNFLSLFFINLYFFEIASVDGFRCIDTTAQRYRLDSAGPVDGASLSENDPPLMRGQVSWCGQSDLTSQRPAAQQTRPNERFCPPERRTGARRFQSPEAMTI